MMLAPKTKSWTAATAAATSYVVTVLLWNTAGVAHAVFLAKITEYDFDNKTAPCQPEGGLYEPTVTYEKHMQVNLFNSSMAYRINCDSGSVEVDNDNDFFSTFDVDQVFGLGTCLLHGTLGTSIVEPSKKFECLDLDTTDFFVLNQYFGDDSTCQGGYSSTVGLTEECSTDIYISGYIGSRSFQTSCADVVGNLVLSKWDNVDDCSGMPDSTTVIPVDGTCSSELNVTASCGFSFSTTVPTTPAPVSPSTTIPTSPAPVSIPSSTMTPAAVPSSPGTTEKVPKETRYDDLSYLGQSSPCEPLDFGTPLVTYSSPDQINLFNFADEGKSMAYVINCDSGKVELDTNHGFLDETFDVDQVFYLDTCLVNFETATNASFVFECVDLEPTEFFVLNHYFDDDTTCEDTFSPVVGLTEQCNIDYLITGFQGSYKTSCTEVPGTLVLSIWDNVDDCSGMPDSTTQVAVDGTCSSELKATASCGFSFSSAVSPTEAPVTVVPTTTAPATSTPTTMAPVTTVPSTTAPATTSPTTTAPATATPTTMAPVTTVPSTTAPATAPATATPTTIAPMSPTDAPTATPVSMAPVTVAPASMAPTTMAPAQTRDDLRPSAANGSMGFTWTTVLRGVCCWTLMSLWW